jgi:hypothetical protein
MSFRDIQFVPAPRSSGCSHLCSPCLPGSAQVRQLGERIFSFEEGGE